MLEDPLLVDLCFNTHHQLLPNSPISRPSVVTEDLREPFLENPFLVDLRFNTLIPSSQDPRGCWRTLWWTYFNTHHQLLPNSPISSPSVVTEDEPFLGGPVFNTLIPSTS
ncbi:hypothetical protein CEXT_361851 [Caerostris extrusa]|uniref:Uncharacterized protein n=1 Tax=Caerostris extrusa TaxID=172846 RepID=A0AAV4TZ17_CAEEX|nr:hypothetical protein CEXT_361851 [Caerostris extrusa]